MSISVRMHGVHGDTESYIGEKQGENDDCNGVGLGKKRLSQQQGNAGDSKSHKKQPDNDSDSDQKRTFHGTLPTS